MELPESNEAPPRPLAQTKLPEEFSFETKTSTLPAEVRVLVSVPGSKSAVPAKDPVV